MKIKLHIQKYPQEGSLRHSYSALRNLIKEDNSISEFNTDELSIDLNNPLNIECQPSYDGTVNLIINDDKNPPRIINSRFTKLEDNKFKIINRNQIQQTNLYKEGLLDMQTRLFRTSSTIPKLSFVDLNYFGHLKGGNYTFYIKLADSDENKTDIVCESGQIPVFKGNLFNINSISGTLSNEFTDKSIKLLLTNIDTSFSKIYVYYSREFSDLNGVRQTETKLIKEPYNVKSDSQEILINGYEELADSTEEQLNIKYNLITNAKTQAQNQNMLFFGNVEQENLDIKNLQNISYFFKVSLKQKDKSIGWINPSSYKSDNYSVTSLEYYDPKNVYYNLGYWPGELYRLGVVYIMNDDSLSPVFNLRGCEFTEVNTEQSNIQSEYTTKGKINYLERDTFINNSSRYDNTFGVFKNPDESKCPILDYSSRQVKPWYYKITIDKELKNELKKYGVKGYFFVRQKRIPITLCQGISVGIDKESGIPMLYDKQRKEYFSESFLSQVGKDIPKDKEIKKDDWPNYKGQLVNTYNNHIIKTSKKKGSALLSVDASLNPNLQSTLDGSEFMLQETYSEGSLLKNDRKYTWNFGSKFGENYIAQQCIYINTDVPYKYINGFGFSTRAGFAESTNSFSFFGCDVDEEKKKSRSTTTMVRGVYSPIIGVCGSLKDGSIYNVRIQNYSNMYMKDYFNIRGHDNSPFYSISDRFENLTDASDSYDIYRGDCFTNTVSLRLLRNFSDPEIPIVDTIMNPETWQKNYNGFYSTNKGNGRVGEKAEQADETTGWVWMNRGDINAVQLGMWVTYKCLSNYNLGFRSEDRSYTEEQALMGTPRSFYPLNDANITSSGKINESFVLNNGYSSTVGKKRNIIVPNVPYIKDIFDNRIMFSNVQTNGMFRNAYRIFQGLSYEDIESKYGAIVKLLPWGVHLLCVFEHGVGVIPINEKALIQTSTNQSVHMYGAGVLQNQISLINPDYGSTWPESIIKTDIGIYGVDTHSKKIWRCTERQGLETISDMHIQRFLNDNILLKEQDTKPIIGLKNVKAHYNNYKGDIMFTFYNFQEGVEWNLCYNERMSKWVTRYSWTPLYSENIDNIYYSLDKKRASLLSYIYDNRHCDYGIRTTNNEWKKDVNNLTEFFDTNIYLNNVDGLTDLHDIKINSIKTSYIDDKEKIYDFTEDQINKFLKINKTDNLTYHLNFDRDKLKSIWTENTTSKHDIPLYLLLNVSVVPEIYHSISYKSITKNICIVVDSNYYPKEYDELLGNGFYIHGRSGIVDEMTKYSITPTKWYNKQESFEFEFVVREPMGMHKIFDNLVIISNNVMPNELEFNIIGDDYTFKNELEKYDFKNVKWTYDHVLKQNWINLTQKCKNLTDPKYGRRLGNIHYKEDLWYSVIDPILFKDKRSKSWSSTKIRDKFLKIRVKYSGEDLAVITALKTLYTISYS